MTGRSEIRIVPTAGIPVPGGLADLFLFPTGLMKVDSRPGRFRWQSCAGILAAWKCSGFPCIEINPPLLRAALELDVLTDCFRQEREH